MLNINHNARRHSAPTKRAPEFVLAMSLYPGAIVLLPRMLITLCVFGFGFFLQCNVITNSIGLRFLHITDPLVMLGIPVLYLLYARAINAGLLLLHIAPITFAFLLSVLLFHERGEGEFYTSAFTYMYMLFFLPFTYLLLKEKLLHIFCWGFFAGFAAASVLLFLDLSLHDRLASLGLSFVFDTQVALEAAARGDTSMLLRTEKMGGIWAHGNEAGPVFALTAAAAGYLTCHYRNVWIFAAFAAIFVASFTLTLNRSGLLAVCLVAAVLYLQNFSIRMFMRSIALAVVALILLGAVLPLGLYDALEPVIEKRFLEDSNAENNVEERLETLGAGVEIFVRNPFGIGASERMALMQNLSGIATPHNGFLSTAYANGALFMLFLAGAILYVVLRRRKLDFYLYAAISLTAAYSFEEVSYNPVMMAVAGMLVAYAAIDLDYRLARGSRILKMPSAKQ